jgi:hypothetical protein
MGALPLNSTISALEVTLTCCGNNGCSRLFFFPEQLPPTPRQQCVPTPGASVSSNTMADQHTLSKCPFYWSLLLPPPNKKTWKGWRKERDPRPLRICCHQMKCSATSDLRAMHTWTGHQQYNGSKPHSWLWMRWWCTFLHNCTESQSKTSMLRTGMTEGNPRRNSWDLVTGPKILNHWKMSLPCGAVSSHLRFWCRTVQRCNQFYQGPYPK